MKNISFDNIRTAQDCIVRHWGEQGKFVIEICHQMEPFNSDFKSFLSHCTMCGGDWGQMLLTGINELWPEVYEAIPNNMGMNAWACLCNTLILCGVVLDD